MSWYLGKILVENKIEDRPKQVKVKYVQISNCFAFNCKFAKYSYSFKVNRELVKKMCSVGSGGRNILPFQYRWSIGYVVREAKGVEELKELRRAEKEYFTKPWMSWFDSDTDFDVFSVIQYVFCLSKSALSEVEKLAKRVKWGKSETKWYSLKEREVVRTRTRNRVGSVSSTSIEKFNETKADALERVAHNKKVAVKKGYIERFIEASKEECKILKREFDRDVCISEWKKMRDFI